MVYMGVHSVRLDSPREAESEIWGGCGNVHQVHQVHGKRPVDAVRGHFYAANLRRRTP